MGTFGGFQGASKARACWELGLEPSTACGLTSVWTSHPSPTEAREAWGSSQVNTGAQAPDQPGTSSVRACACVCVSVSVFSQPAGQILDTPPRPGTWVDLAAAARREAETDLDCSINNQRGVLSLLVLSLTPCLPQSPKRTRPNLQWERKEFAEKSVTREVLFSLQASVCCAHFRP